MTVHIHDGDLPEGVTFGAAVAVDSETMGLNPHRDRLCVAQLSAGDGTAHLVKFAPGPIVAPRLAALLADPETLKIFHSAREGKNLKQSPARSMRPSRASIASN
ncbi:MAG: hypothetical protein AAGM38_15015, partial [Pseudomonadota bacterium]